MKEKILITGGAGYIGSVLVPRLLEKKYKVTVLDNFLYGQSSLLECCRYSNFSVIKGDCRNHDLIKSLIEKFDVFIPLAALVGAPACDLDPIAAKSINQDSIDFLCENLKDNQKIIMPVSNSGYGVGEKGKFCDEKSPLNPISLYGKTKVNAESRVLQRENSITFRLATVFGASPRMRTDLLVNDFTYRAVNDNAIVIFEGHFKRNYIHIQDVANVFIFALENFEKMKSNTFNVGLENANLSKLELCDEIKKIVPNFTYLESQIGQDPDKRDYIVSNKKIMDLGFAPEWNLSQGIAELVKAYKIIKNTKFGNI